MAVARPKILTAITVPAGGWDLDFTVNTALATPATYTATVPAGDYFISWDAETDDLLYQLSLLMTAQVVAVANRRVYVRLTSANKVQFEFGGSGFVDSVGWENDVSLDWTTSAAGLAAALGFDNSADDSDTSTDNPTFTGDWQHGYGWYSATGGQLESLLVEDTVVTDTPQSIGYSGHVAAYQIGQRYTNEIRLRHLERDETFSRGVTYGTAPVEPYDRNKGLECWWLEAVQGTRFRVYRDGRNDATAPIERGDISATTTSSISDGSKTWSTEPRPYLGSLAHIENRFDTADTGRFKVTSQTSGTLSSTNNAPDGEDWGTAAGTRLYYVLNNSRFQTYVVDLKRMREFKPRELPAIDRYDVTIPLLRYES